MELGSPGLAASTFFYLLSHLTGRFSNSGLGTQISTVEPHPQLPVAPVASQLNADVHAGLW